MNRKEPNFDFFAEKIVVEVSEESVVLLNTLLAKEHRLDFSINKSRLSA